MYEYSEEEIYDANRRIAAYNKAVVEFEDDLDCLVIFLLAKEKNKRRKVHKMYKERNAVGAHSLLISRHLIDDDTKFQQYLRLTPYLFNNILELVKDDLEKTPTTWIRKPITPHFKLCVTLRYLATGETFRSLAFQFRAHYTTVSRIVKDTLCAIVKHLLHIALPVPTNDSFKQSINDFFTKWNYPNCCGAIDGKHIRIKAPPNAGSAFFIYKEYHSVVLLAIVDANLKFNAIDVGSYGREGDAGIYLKSEMGKLINCGKFNIPEPTALPYTDVVLPIVILGDEAFALHINMMKPFPRAQSLTDRTKAIYNYRHSRGRRTTENVFGIMCSYFPIFFTPIQIKLDAIDNIIIAACILHNMLRNERISSPVETTFENLENVQMPHENLISLSNSAGRPHTTATIIRDRFKEYFNGFGAVLWQDNMI